MSTANIELLICVDAHMTPALKRAGVAVNALHLRINTERFMERYRFWVGR